MQYNSFQFSIIKDDSITEGPVFKPVISKNCIFLFFTCVQHLDCCSINYM